MGAAMAEATVEAEMVAVGMVVAVVGSAVAVGVGSGAAEAGRVALVVWLGMVVAVWAHESVGRVAAAVMVAQTEEVSCIPTPKAARSSERRQERESTPRSLAAWRFAPASPLRTA